MPYDEALVLSRSYLTPELFQRKGWAETFEDHRLVLHGTGWSLRTLLAEAQRRVTSAIEAARRAS